MQDCIYIVNATDTNVMVTRNHDRRGGPVQFTAGDGILGDGYAQLSHAISDVAFDADDRGYDKYSIQVTDRRTA